MKKLLPFLIFTTGIFVVLCERANQRAILEKGTPPYNFGKNLAAKIPALDPDENKTLLKTNQFEITSAEMLKLMYANMGKSVTQFLSIDTTQLRGMLSKIVQDLAEKKLLLNAATSNYVEVTQAEVDSALERQYGRFGGQAGFQKFLTENDIAQLHAEMQLKEGLIIDKYLNMTLLNQIQVSADELHSAYQEDITATVRHILLKTQGKSESEKAVILSRMEEILARARKGEDFAQLAEKASEDLGSRENGGLYENFGRGTMVKSFEDAAFSVSPGEISDIIETPYGYHILKVINRKKEERPLDSIRTELQTKLEQKKKNEIYLAHVEKLKTEANYKEIIFLR
jgi:parvulin-like peptidyl-prolyl isomerase